MATAAKYHHERYDGKGYPGGLAGENVPEHARIIGVADAYDAMASNRSYRNALPQSVIRSELLAGRRTQFDPRIVEIMVQIMDEDTEYRLCQTDDFSRTILVVDDEDLSVELVKNILETQSGYEILTAGSGEEDLRQLENHSVNLVLQDIEMPKMDGFETLKRIKEHYAVPVVFMTATKELSMVEKARRLGSEDYVTKPFTPQILLETVYGALNWEE